MDPGGFGGAFGGTKAGGQVDPLSYIKRPAVVLRICALVSNLSYQLFSIEENYLTDTMC